MTVVKHTIPLLISDRAVKDNSKNIVIIYFEPLNHIFKPTPITN